MLLGAQFNTVARKRNNKRPDSRKRVSDENRTYSQALNIHSMDFLTYIWVF